MKATIEVNELRQAVKAAGTSAGRRSSMPILHAVKITPDGEGVTIRGTDLESWSTARAAGVVESADGEAVVSSSILGKILAKVKGGNVELSTAGGVLTLYCNETQTDIPMMPSEDFPEQSERIGAVHICDLSGATFKAMAGRAKKCARKAGGTTRIQLTGVAILYGAGVVKFVTTDGYHLLVEEYDAAGGESGELLIDAAAVQRVASLVKASDVVRLEALPAITNEERLVISFRGSSFTIRGINEEFPDFARVIPSAVWPDATELNVDRARLAAMVERAAIVADDLHEAVTLTMEAGCLLGSSGSLELGTFCETMPAAVKLQDDGREMFDISFSCPLLLETLKGTKAETACLTFTESLQATRVRFDDAPALSWVLMPVTPNL